MLCQCMIAAIAAATYVTTRQTKSESSANLSSVRPARHRTINHTIELQCKADIFVLKKKKWWGTENSPLWDKQMVCGALEGRYHGRHAE